MSTMRRLVIAVAFPPLAVLLFGVGAWLYVDVLGYDASEKETIMFGYIFLWPLQILHPLIPASDNPHPYAALIRYTLYVIVILCAWGTYSLLIYLIAGRIIKRR